MLFNQILSLHIYKIFVRTFTINCVKVSGPDAGVAPLDRYSVLNEKKYATGGLVRRPFIYK